MVFLVFKIKAWEQINSESTSRQVKQKIEKHPIAYAYI